MEYGSLIQKILLDITSTPDKFFSNIDYNPPRTCHFTLVCKKELTEDFIQTIKSLRYVESIEVVKPFLNLCFNGHLVSLFDISSSDINKTASVEHTSTVAVYPLSIAVFRSSVIGEWIRRALVYLGFSTKGRIWVQDSARQVSLVTQTLQSDHYRVAKKAGIGKGDHTIGRIFAESILRMDGGDEVSTRKVKKIVAELFPLGQSGVRRPRYSNWINDVLLGWRSTFDLAGIHIDKFDRDKNLTSNEWEEIIHAARDIKLENPFLVLSKGVVKEENLTYVERSILYYCYLLRQSQTSFSLVPYRQLEKQQFAKKIACAIEKRKTSDLRVIPFGDTRVDNKIDSIKGRRFTTVDNLSQYSDRNISSLLEKYLTTRASSNINIVFPLYPVESYVGVQRVTTILPIPKAILLLDELPLLLKKSLKTGDFTRVTQWTARARVIKDQIDVDYPSIAKKMSFAIDLFSPFSSNPRL